ncbi:polyketide cyclase/dehydrase [Trichuris suis]|nr:polyketide cyclase/dehydrase [Trichuris suis]
MCISIKWGDDEANGLVSFGYLKENYKFLLWYSMRGCCIDCNFNYPIEKMFGIAADVNRYKEFVPWCIGSKIVRKVDERCSEVQLTVGFPPVVESYVSTSVSSDTRLFKQLISIWQFYVVDSDPANTCHLSFSVGYKLSAPFFTVMYEFQSPLHAAIASLFFDEVTKKMIVAFTERARTLYGPPSAVV